MFAMKENTRRAILSVFLLLAVAFTLFAPMLAFAADSGACYNIQDSDARTLCLARAHREPAQCYSIKRADVRSQCLAEVRK